MPSEAKATGVLFCKNPADVNVHPTVVLLNGYSAMPLPFRLSAPALFHIPADVADVKLYCGAETVPLPDSSGLAAPWIDTHSAFDVLLTACAKPLLLEPKTRNGACVLT